MIIVHRGRLKPFAIFIEPRVGVSRDAHAGCSMPAQVYLGSGGKSISWGSSGRSSAGSGLPALEPAPEAGATAVGGEVDAGTAMSIGRELAAGVAAASTRGAGADTTEGAVSAGAAGLAPGPPWVG